jgi:hypothetical protein
MRNESRIHSPTQIGLPVSHNTAAGKVMCHTAVVPLHTTGDDTNALFIGFDHS